MNATTLIAIPALVTSPERATALVERLRMISVAHPSAEFRFALLSDFADASAETCADDDRILARLQGAIAELNRTARDTLGDRFFVLHRRRTWSATQDAWIGWERKRGKLRELIGALSADPRRARFAWEFGDLSEVLSRTSIPFVILLDETTWLEPGAASQLIRTAAHPQNQPAVDRVTNRIISGYTVLQPTLVSMLDGSAPTTPDFRTERPPPPKPRLVGPSFHFKTFDAALHKGPAALYNVAGFRTVLEAAFPDDLVLHHDLLDGFAGRTGEVYSAVACQPWPRTYIAQAQRGHRWLRGLFQTMPFLLPKTRDASGNLRLNPLSTNQRYFIVELALQELSKPASLVLLLLAWTVLPGSAALWTLVACPPLFLLSVYAVRLMVVRRGRPRAPGPALARWHPLFKNAVASLLAQVVLVHSSFLVIDALGRVSWRLLVSRKQLLEWVPWREKNPSGALSAYWRLLWASPVVGGLTIGLLMIRSSESPAIGAVFALAWIIAPVVVGLGDRHFFRPTGPD